MGEVEAELVRADGGARLAHVLAQYVAKRLVQEVCGGVVRHRREAVLPGDDGPDAVARRKAVAPEGQHLVVPDPGRPHQLGMSTALLVLDEPDVRDLPAALGIERRLL